MRLSASSINSQPWKFVVIGSDAAKEQMNKAFVNKFQFNQLHVFDSSHIILFASNARENYSEVVDSAVEDGRTKPEDKEKAFGAFIFAEMNTDEAGYSGEWTKAQTYIALGNALHTLARLRIDSATMEGIDTDLVNEAFKTELCGYQCVVALAIGYRHPQEDYNSTLPKSRLKLSRIMLRI